jgi:hypothetical protein
MATCNVYEEAKKGICDQIKAEGSWDCLWKEGEKCTETLCLRANVMVEMRDLMEGELGKVEGAQGTHSDKVDTLEDAIDEYRWEHGKA